MSESVVGVLYLFLGLWLFSVAILLPFPRMYKGWLGSAGGFAAMFFVWFLPHFFLLGGLATALVWTLNALTTLPGQLGLGLHVLSWLFMLQYLGHMPAVRLDLNGKAMTPQTLPFLDDLPEAAREALPVPKARWLEYLTQVDPERNEVEILRGIPYYQLESRTLKCDVYRMRGHSQSSTLLPCVLVIHGGGWIVGSRRQFRFTCMELARAGFVVFAITYRLAPAHPLPAAVEDVKAAIAFIKAQAAEYGGRPDFVAVLGGSAGGHLTALAGLSANEPTFQPGFEDADTSIQAMVPLYGVMDWTRSLQPGKNPAMRWLLETLVIKHRYADHPELFEFLEPLSWKPDQVPPTLLVHGVADRMVSVRDSRTLFEHLQSMGASGLYKLEVNRAPHAFDCFLNPLQERANYCIVHFLGRAWRDFLRTHSNAPR